MTTATEQKPPAQAPAKGILVTEKALAKVRSAMAADLQLNSRLGCQAQITKPGKVVVEIPAWNRNYVSEEH